MIKIKTYALTQVQKEIMEIDLSPLLADSNVNTLCGVFWFDNKYSAEIVEKAFNLIYENEEGARIHFCKENGEYRQYVMPYKPIKLPVVEAPDMTADEFREMLNTSADRKIGFLDDSLCFQKLYYLKDAMAVLMVGHHLMCDGYTWGLIGHRLGELCHKLDAGEPVELALNSYLPVIEREEKQFASKHFADSCNYWRERLADWEGLSRISTVDADEEDIDAAHYVVPVKGDALEKIMRYCRANSLLPETLFLTAMVLYMHKLNPEKKKIVLGQNIPNRENHIEKKTIGMFAAEGIICVDADASITLEELLKRTVEAGYKMLFTSPCCYDHILEIVRENNPEVEEIRVAEFSYQVNQNLREYGIKAEIIPNYMPEVPLDINVMNLNAADDIELIIDYRTAAFPKGTIAKVAGFILDTAALISEKPDTLLKDIPLML